jgi:hypothetical protein
MSWFCALPLLVSGILLAFIFGIRTHLSKFRYYLGSTECCDIHILHLDRQLTCLCKLQIRMKVIPPNTQRNWSDIWTLQHSLLRTWNVLSSDKDVQHNAAACSVRIRNFEWKMNGKNADGNNPAWIWEGWSAISQEFRTLLKEERECLGYKPDDRRFGFRFSGDRYTVFLATASRLVLKPTHSLIWRVSGTFSRELHGHSVKLTTC